MTDLPNTPLQLSVNTTNTLTAARIETTVPVAYRLVTKGDGNGDTIYVLQGYFTWMQGWSQRGGEWRDLETQDWLTAQDDIPFRC
jgi:hypothetical protein